MIKEVLLLYGLNPGKYAVENFGSGLINYTWIITNHRQYILQRVNKNVFSSPSLIDENIRSLSDYLQLNKPAYNLIKPLPSISGKTLVQYENDYYRLLNFVSSTTYLVAESSSVAYEAAKQFGKFTKNLCGFNAEKLHETISRFHDIKFRYTQFSEALKAGNKEKINQSEKIIQVIQQYKNIIDVYDALLTNPAFKKRVTHHDTKISNVLFGINNKGIAVIDLDTVMPGYFISDVGDMLRTYLSPVSEEETDFNLIEVRDAYFKAIAEGYLSEMKNELSEDELNAFVYAGKFMIYMQALRFITDYFNDDIYYGAKYPHHNYNRTQNQLVLLQKLIEKEILYKSIVEAVVNNK